ncbi:phage portal protein [Cohnella cholangitidis]|uniref:phage portal protein n=1 Tax=Cohnella cholangitidis TaxID=2598458 RepID=UPI001C70B5B8|nr:phage portal protein [Cohnella cholangitidis]
MGMWQRFTNVFKKESEASVSAAQIIDLLNRGTPLMSFGKDLYNIPEVRTAINFVAEKVGCIPFYHARADTKGNVTPINSRLQYVLTIRTNPYQTPQVFWTYVVTRCS